MAQKYSFNFKQDGADGGKIANELDTDGVKVKAIDINQFLNKNKVDYLKMDIEGAEDFVFPQ